MPSRSARRKGRRDAGVARRRHRCAPVSGVRSVVTRTTEPRSHGWRCGDFGRCCTSCSDPFTLIAGAGGALEAAPSKAVAEERVDIEVLAPETDFVYKPLAVAEPFGKGEVRSFPVRRLIELAGARPTEGSLSSVDLGAGESIPPTAGKSLGGARPRRWRSNARGRARRAHLPGTRATRGARRGRRCRVCRSARLDHLCAAQPSGVAASALRASP